ncbi:MAG: PKD domain-containing protein, partial [Thermoplasmatales archaeon]|nr:PKD domain-containing protein [Thermoplasmatales archaeon]
MKKITIIIIVIALFLGNFGNFTIADYDDLKILNEEFFPATSKNKARSGKIEQRVLNLINPNTRFNVLDGNQLTDFDYVTDKVRLEVILSDEKELDTLKNFNENIEIENHYKSLVQVLIPINLIQTLSEERYVQYIRRPVKPHLMDIISEGVSVIGADSVHNEGVYGNGSKVAVIDIGFLNYSSNPELPSERIAEVKSFRADGDIECGEIHGSACAEIVLDVAPQADLYLYNFETISELNSTVSHAISVGVDIISFSIGYEYINNFDGVGYPGIGDVCGIVDNARSNGVLFVTASGNEAEHHYEGTYTDNNSNGWHEFGNGDEELDLGYLSKDTIYNFELTWNDWPYSDQDYDLYLFDSDFDLIDWSENVQNGSQPPREWINGYIPYDDWYYLDISRWNATESVDFELYGNNEIPFPEYNHPESSLSCPADAFGSMAVGATYWQNDSLEGFSSRGPTNDNRTKPDVTAPDGVSTYAYESGPFYGTSASTPHVAGAAALLLSVGPLCTADDLQDLLETSALDLGSSGKDNLTGSGRINVWNAYNRMKPTANFTYSPENPSTQDVVQFNDTSTDEDGMIVSWLWDFGDGNISVEQHPTHQYPDGGIYNITLNVTDDDGATDTTFQNIDVYNSLMIYYIDVGQGDSILIQTPENNFVLIDAGKQSSSSTVVNFLNNRSVNTLKAFIASHPDADHIGGADEVIENFDVLSIYHPGYEKNTSTYQEFIAAAENESCPIYTDDELDPGDFINISSIISCQILHIDKNASNSNDASVVLRVDFNLASFLFTGDISSDVESGLIQNQNVDIDILKVAHHGSKYSTSNEFLNAASTPSASVISVGNNPYGHPAPETITRLIAHNSTIYRTDLNGTITITTFGTTWNVTVEKTIMPNNPPMANFTYSPQNPTTLDVIYLTDTSEDVDGTIVSWLWDFGDGNTSIQQNPTHQYADNGVYNVTLNVTDDDNTTDEINQQIAVANVPPVVNFTYIPSIPTVNDIVQFNDTSIDLDGTIVDWTWDFGDGNTSTSRNTTHQYLDNITYNVTLTVTDNDGDTNSTTKEII